MNTTTRIGIIALLIVIVIGIAFVIMRMQPQATGTNTGPIQSTNTLSYLCNAGKTIQAVYHLGASKPPASSGQPPTPGGSVDVTLSDGRNMTLAQTISADGARYATSDESFVFWSKGNGALVLENNQEKSFTGCIQVAPDTGGLSQVYQNGPDGFSLRYPVGYTVDESYHYQSLGPGHDISGIKFTIPASMATGTNLGSDTYVSVEEIPHTQSCSALLFLSSGATVKNTTDAGTTYSVASVSDAGAGNRYEETVYALPGTNPCIGVRYFVHYSVIDNYPPGTVKQFDSATLLKQFDSIRRALIISQ